MTFRQGDSGDAVGAAQQALLESGCSIDAGELSRHLFGPSTYDAVLHFQASHVDLQGHALTQDGKIGTMTTWALEHQAGGRAGYTAPGWRADLASEPEEVRQVLSAAIAEIGTVEVPDGSNRGPRVDVYTAPFLGSPWCAYFVSWAWSRRTDGSPFGRTGSVHDLLRWATANGKLVAGLPQPGDIFLIIRDDVHGHCGLVVSADPGTATVCTCEGNAGNATRGLVRRVGSITHFVKPLGG